MKKTFITFGQIHTHSVGGRTFDKDCVASIESSSEEEGRKKAFEYFGNKWHMSYFKEELDKDILDFYPRGIISV